MTSTAPQDEVRHSVISKDGTEIAYWRSGDGPALVLVHGTSADHTRWRPVMDAFRRHFSVCAMDRRGRGGSGDSDTYEIQREFEDVTAVIDSQPAPAHVLGHSYGGLCALGASLLAAKLDRMVLYEPPVLAEDSVPVGLGDRLESLVAEGRPEDALVLFVTDMLRMSPAQLEAFRSLPAWPARVAAAHTLSRELKGWPGFDATAFANHTIPTLILEGGDSPPFLKASNAVVHEALRSSAIEVLPGQQHVAIDTATDLFSERVLAFLSPQIG